MNSLCFCLVFVLIFCLVNFDISSFVLCSSDDDRESQSLSLIAEANDRFCFRLLHQLEIEAEIGAKDDNDNNLKNLFISPLSISSLLVMLMANTGNETYLQIRNALGFDSRISEAEIYSTYSHLLQKYQHLHTETPESSLDNLISQLTYNNAVEMQPDQSLLLLNENHFTGFWERRFYKEFTQLKSFTSSNGQTLQVPTMHRYFARENFAKFEDGELLELPFFSPEETKNQPSLSMFIFLPNESPKTNSLNPISEQFASFGVSNRLDQLLSWKVDIELPRFNIASSHQLKGALTEMGVMSVFSQGADFSRIYKKGNESLKNEQNLRLADLIHRASIDVVESGAEDKTTNFKREKKGKRPLSQPRRVMVNRRFLFMIRDTDRQLTLFAGVINKIQ